MDKVHWNEFAEKLGKKAVGAFLNFPRFALAHCMPINVLLRWT